MPSPLLGIHPEESIIQKDTCTVILIATLFTIVRTWKQPECPPTEEWIKTWYFVSCVYIYIYTTECYSAVKNEIESLVEESMDLESFKQSEVSQRKTNIRY